MDEYLSPAQVAGALGLNTDYVRQLIRARKIRARKDPGSNRWLVPRAAVDERLGPRGPDRRRAVEMAFLARAEVDYAPRLLALIADVCGLGADELRQLAARKYALDPEAAERLWP